MTIERLRLGESGEELAKRFLESSGYCIVARNWRCKLAEIDIIARDGETLVFIEVKTRTDSAFGSPADAVTLRKQRQIGKAAQWYLAEHDLFGTPARFDVIAIVLGKGGRHQVEHIPAAFELCE